MGAGANLDELMFECGLDSLHPGGLRQTEALARMCGIGRGMKVLDAGSGRGATAMHLARTFGCLVVGIDRQQRMVDHASSTARKEGLVGSVRFVGGDIQKLPFDAGSFDVVFSECTTTLVDRSRAFAEFLRVLKPGGRLGDSDVIWTRTPPDDLVERARATWEGFSTLTLDGWRTYLESLGLTDVRSADFTQPPAELEADMKRELGPGRLFRLGILLISRPDLRAAVMEYGKMVTAYGNYFGYASFAGTKS